MYLFFTILFFLFKKGTSNPNPFVCTVNSFGGSLIKKLVLEKEFNPKFSPNIFYFVSSDLPYFAAIIFFIAKVFKIKIIFNQNGTYFPAWFNGDCFKKNQIFAQYIYKADYIIFQSNFCKKMAQKFVLRQKINQPHSIIHNCARDTGFLRQRKYVIGKKIKICVAGSFNFKERLETAFDICKELAKYFRVYLNIFGKYDNKGYIKKNFKKNKSFSFAFKGKYQNSKIGKIFASHDLLIHTQPYDCCPSIICEAMASGLPLVAQQNGGIPELVGTKYCKFLIKSKTSCYKYDWGSPKKYALKIKKILCNSKYIKKYFKQRSQLFNEKTFYLKHKKVFAQILR